MRKLPVIVVTALVGTALSLLIVIVPLGAVVALARLASLVRGRS